MSAVHQRFSRCDSEAYTVVDLSEKIEAALTVRTTVGARRWARSESESNTDFGLLLLRPNVIGHRS